VHSRNISLIAWGNNKDKGANRESFYFYAPDELNGIPYALTFSHGF